MYPALPLPALPRRPATVFGFLRFFRLFMRPGSSSERSETLETTTAAQHNIRVCTSVPIHIHVHYYHIVYYYALNEHRSINTVFE